MSSVELLSAAAPYLAIVAVLLGVAGIVVGITAHRRVRRLYVGSNDTMEDIIKELSRQFHELEIFRGDTERYLAHAEQRLRRSVRGVGVVRFNPFQGDGSGGNQSFSAAFLDEHHNGVVFSALYARTGASSMYAKPIAQGVSQFELTEEEEEAVRIASERAHPTFVPNSHKE